MRLALTGTAMMWLEGAAQAQQQSSPLAGGAGDRGGYASNVVVNESFRSFAGGRRIQAAGDVTALERALAAPQTLTRDLGVSLMPGLEIQSGSSTRIFETAPSRLGAAPDRAAGRSQAKLITLHGLAYQGVPLAPGSDVLSIATTTGEVTTIRERNIPQSVDGATPELAAEEAIRVALAVPRTPAAPAGSTARAADLEVFVGADGRGRLAWRVHVEADSLTAPWAREIWVAAIGEPIVLADREAIFHIGDGHSGRVTATAWTASPFAGTASYPLDRAHVRRTGSAGGTEVTDFDGRYAFFTGTGSATLAATTSGLFSIVDNVPGAELAASAVGAPREPINLALNAVGDLELAQTSAYVWTNFARRLTEDSVPATALADLPTQVNIADSCNAFWNGSSINFFQAGGGCPNTAYSDVVLHEYGHGVDARLGRILDGGYSEGFGDALALIGTRQPCLGRDFFGAGTCLRPATDVILWPPGGGEGVHAIGRRYAGFTWALITGLQTIYAPDDAFEVARQLVMAAASANPASIPDAVGLSFLLDDDDGDPSTCSPHFTILAAAADSRHIPRPPNCAALWVADYGAIGGVWQVEKHPRFLADVNADGKADIVGFGDDAVWVSTSTGTGFTTPARWVEAFTVNNGGWQVAKNPRFLADVNADGKADIVGFGDEAVWVSTSTGGSFTAPALWVEAFAINNGGWQVDKHPRFLADVNADGKADIVGFGDDAVWVSTSTGGGFTEPAPGSRPSPSTMAAGRSRRTPASSPTSTPTARPTLSASAMRRSGSRPALVAASPRRRLGRGLRHQQWRLAGRQEPPHSSPTSTRTARPTSAGSAMTGFGSRPAPAATSPRRRSGSRTSPSTTAAGRSPSTRASSPTSAATAGPTSSASAISGSGS